MPLSVRLATEVDAPVIADLALEFATENPSASETALEDLSKAAKAVRDLLELQHCRLIVAQLDTIVVAAMVLFAIPSLVHGGRPSLLLELLVVRKEFRRKGIATALVKHADDVARASGAYKIFLITRSDNTAATNLYRKCGFASTNAEFSYYTRDHHKED